MFPPIYSTCADNVLVQAQLGTTPTRFYPFGEAPAGVSTPYAVWQMVGGLPENCLSDVPDIDSYALQIDVYGDTVDAVRDAAEAMRDAIEPVAHIVAWRGESRDPTTKRYRFSFDVDFFEYRSNQS